MSTSDSRNDDVISSLLSGSQVNTNTNVDPTMGFFEGKTAESLLSLQMDKITDSLNKAAETLEDKKDEAASASVDKDSGGDSGGSGMDSIMSIVGSFL